MGRFLELERRWIRSSDPKFPFSPSIQSIATSLPLSSRCSSLFPAALFHSPRIEMCILSCSQLVFYPSLFSSLGSRVSILFSLSKGFPRSRKGRSVFLPSNSRTSLSLTLIPSFRKQTLEAGENVLGIEIRMFAKSRERME